MTPGGSFVDKGEWPVTVQLCRRAGVRALLNGLLSPRSKAAD